MSPLLCLPPLTATFTHIPLVNIPVGTTEPPPSALEHPRCPFSQAGLGAETMRACPGFEAEQVSFEGVEVPGRYPGKAMPAGVSCRHLGFTDSPRGWRSECRHPRGLPALWPPISDGAVIEATGSEATIQLTGERTDRPRGARFSS